MKSNKLYGSLVGLIVALFAISMISAGALNVNINEVTMNDVVLTGSNTIGANAGENVPVVVQFTSDTDLQDLKVKVWVEGYKNDVSASTARFDTVNGSTYIKRLALTLPNVNDMDNSVEGLTLYVRIADKNDEVENSYQVKLQRESYSFNVLSVEAPLSAKAGDIIPLDIVLKNTGLRELDDAFVTATIAELGVQRNVYFGDLTPNDTCDNCDKEDARERIVYLVIPSDAPTGNYNIVVKATNYDSTTTVKKVISITGSTAGNQTTVTPGSNTSSTSGIPTSVVVLTVVLVIVFVVLLIVLIVLLTKKPSEKVEDFGETSYY